MTLNHVGCGCVARKEAEAEAAKASAAVGHVTSADVT